MAGDIQRLPVHEQFHSWQGEGVHLGRSAYFIRLFGCPVHCPWCDSAGTWHPEYVPKNVEKASVSELVDKAKASGADFVVVTGGEPAIHDLRELTQLLRDTGLPVHLETSGAFEIRGKFDWITLSPKWQKLPLAENLSRASEFKIIVENENSIEKWIQEVGEFLKDGSPVWLHPEWSQRANPKVLESITNTVKKRGNPFRAGYQMHKLFRADEMDSGSRKAVPLGGDVEQGF